MSYPQRDPVVFTWGHCPKVNAKRLSVQQSLKYTDKKRLILEEHESNEFKSLDIVEWQQWCDDDQLWRHSYNEGVISSQVDHQK